MMASALPSLPCVADSDWAKGACTEARETSDTRDSSQAGMPDQMTGPRGRGPSPPAEAKATEPSFPSENESLERKYLDIVLPVDED